MEKLRERHTQPISPGIADRTREMHHVAVPNSHTLGAQLKEQKLQKNAIAHARDDRTARFGPALSSSDARSPSTVGDSRHCRYWLVATGLTMDEQATIARGHRAALFGRSAPRVGGDMGESYWAPATSGHPRRWRGEARVPQFPGFCPRRDATPPVEPVLDNQG
ncbi:MAG: hypothetical protein ACREFP_15625 [Acetobacteraceae bacterium]